MRIESDSHHNLSTPVFGMDLKNGNRPISSLLVYHRFLFSFLPCLSDSFPYSPPYSNMPSRWCFEREVNDGTKECIIDIRLLKQSFDTLCCKHQWLKNPHIKIWIVSIGGQKIPMANCFLFKSIVKQEGEIEDV